jgi:NAD(P)-dependent dehydrogenase (short-subunit alcohol dehydrogenase family)
MEPKVAIVTGASSGIGKEAARALMRAGYVVYAAARRTDAMKDLEAEGARVHHLDLTQDDSIAGFARAVVAEAGRIDVLVNNAGYGAYGAVEELPMKEARAQMEVNLFGLAQMIRAVTPVMRAQRSGRILNVTSIGGKIWSPLGGWYHASKFAVEGLSDALRNELRPFGIDVVIIEPGGTKTEWTDIAVESMKRTSGQGPYKPLVDAWVNLAKHQDATASPAQIAKVIAHAATVRRRPRARYVAPALGSVFLFLKWMLTDSAFDWVLSLMFRLPKTIPA